jgi:RNase P subunit RPR2
MFRRPGQLRLLKGWEDRDPLTIATCPECGSYYLDEVKMAYRVLPLMVEEPVRTTADTMGVLYRCLCCGWAGNRPRGTL